MYSFMVAPLPSLLFMADCLKTLDDMVCMCISIYIYIYTEREREREMHMHLFMIAPAPSFLRVADVFVFETIDGMVCIYIYV